MRDVRTSVLSAIVLCAISVFPVLAQDVMRGHGGPVRALAVNGPARELISGSFDSTVIVWDLTRGTAKRVLRFHEGPVNAVAVLENGCFASGGEDKRVAVWCGEESQPRAVLSHHQGPITALFPVLGDGLASASFDGSARITSNLFAIGKFVAPIVQRESAITGLARDPAGKLIAVSADGSVSVGFAQILRLIAPMNGVVATSDGEIVVASADGRVRFISSELKLSAELEVENIPLTSLALSPDGKLIATAGVRGGIAIIDRASRKIVHRLTGPGLPVWSLAFDTDSRTLLSGGADRTIRRWDAVEGRALSPTLPERDVVAEAAASGERGAVVFRACQACHTLSPDDGNRAGPTLHGLYGRRIGTARGYAYSEALPKMSIVWSKETVARLFEIGPNAYTPGTKMPEQTINNADDRRALVEWLERVTR